ncbi:MAG: crotonase/enoyl-CoA hydratase family protein [Pirellulales bacterium]|nr:crotonase/enoyl-CoA hydratase family protein [Pirellulales bacterium]
MSSFETISLEVDARGMARLRLNRPESKNAMSPQMIVELRAAGRKLAEEPSVRGIVLTGAGDVFCAGGDLKGMQKQAQGTREERIQDATELAEMLAEWNMLPKPIIGRINGSAFGGGIGLISVCDLAIGVTSAKFCLTEVRLGLIPATISPYVVARLGVPNARRVMLNAREMDAAMAVRLGLLSEAVAPDELDAAVEREISALLQCAPGAVGNAKALIRFVSTHDTPANIEYTARALADAWESAEVAEGIQAFLTRQKPKWCVE